MATAAVTRVSASATASCSAPRVGGGQVRAAKPVVLRSAFKQGGAVASSSFMGQSLKLEASVPQGRGLRNVTTCAAKGTDPQQIALALAYNRI